MRTPEAKIREAILHPEPGIRLTALSYFSRANGRDESIMPLVVQAAERYGRDWWTCHLLGKADDLVQTEATVQWLVKELSRDWDLDDISNDNYCFAVAQLLCSAEPDLLQASTTELRGFPDELRDRFLQRLTMADWDWETGWSALEKLHQTVLEQDSFREGDVLQESLIVESLARHRDKSTLVVDLLEHRAPYVGGELADSMEGALVELAGRMRLQEATPALVRHMHGDDLDLSDYSTRALQWIGGDSVVRVLAADWTNSIAYFRNSAAEVMGDIHTDLSVETALRAFAAETDPETKGFLAGALVDNFAEEAVEPVRQMLLENEIRRITDDWGVKSRTVALCTVAGTTFPELERWREQAIEANWGWPDLSGCRVREGLFRDEGDEDDDWDWAPDAPGVPVKQDHGRKLDDASEPTPPIRRDPETVGRNAPCPCGSGKKHKKCCMNKNRPKARDERTE